MLLYHHYAPKSTFFIFWLTEPHINCSSFPFLIDFCEIWLNVSFFQESITGEGLRIATDRLDSKNFYAFNPSFDVKKPNMRKQ